MIYVMTLLTWRRGFWLTSYMSSRLKQEVIVLWGIVKIDEPDVGSIYMAKLDRTAS